MKSITLYFSLIFLLLSAELTLAADTSYNRVKVSVTLSGHILLGVGFEHGFNTHHALQATVYPLMIPGEGFPFALSAGYNYYFGRNKWQGKIGGAMAMLVSPPDPHKRKTMPMLLFTPGLQYTIKQNHSALIQPWLAFFLKKTKHRFAPIGLEFQYGYNF